MVESPARKIVVFLGGCKRKEKNSKEITIKNMFFILKVVKVQFNFDKKRCLEMMLSFGIPCDLSDLIFQFQSDWNSM
jgi:hypothetical protein